MLKSAIIFCLLGLFVFILGVSEFGGVTRQVGLVLLLVFLLFSFFSLIAGLTISKSRDRMIE